MTTSALTMDPVPRRAAAQPGPGAGASYGPAIDRSDLLTGDEEKRLARRMQRCLDGLRRVAGLLARKHADLLRDSGLDPKHAGSFSIDEAGLLTAAAERGARDPGRSLEARLVRRLRGFSRRLQDAREALALANLRLVVHVAKQYHDAPLPLPDRIQEGNIGLLRAVDRFDPERGTKFSTYAYAWIQQAIDRAIIKQGRTVPLPFKRYWERRKIAQETKTLFFELGRTPTLQEVASAVDLPESRVRETIQTSLDVKSIDDDDGPDVEASLSDGSPRQEQHLFEVELVGAIRKRLDDMLTPREVRVLVLRFGLDARGTRNREEIGRMLGISRERVRQIENKAIDRLRGSEVLAELYANLGGS